MPRTTSPGLASVMSSSVQATFVGVGTLVFTGGGSGLGCGIQITMAAITTNATRAARKSLGAELLSWGTASPLSRLQLGELVWGDDDHPRTHGVMSGAAEFMAGHGMFAGGGERELRL